jgi:hypothetical protein
MPDTEILAGAGTNTDGGAVTESTTSDATQTSNDKATTSSSSTTDWDKLFKSPEGRERIKSLIEADEELKEQVVKPVRKSLIDKRVKEEAAKFKESDPEIAQTRKQVQELQDALSKMRDAQEASLLATMSNDEQSMFRLAKRAQQAEIENRELKTWRSKMQEEKAKEDILNYAKTKLKLEEDDIEELQDADTAEKLVFKAMELAAERREKESKTNSGAYEAMKARLESLERQLSGESVHVAGGTGSAGGDDSVSDNIVDEYLATSSDDPKYARIQEKYDKYRQSKGWS